MTFLSILEPAAADDVRVRVIQGSVEINRNPRSGGFWDGAQTNSILSVGHQIRTGPRSRAVLQLSDRSTISLTERTVAEITESEKPGVLVNLWRGIIYFFHRDRPGNIEMRSPSLQAVVRGTEFVFRVDEISSTLQVIDGEVALTNELGAISLVSGQAGVAKVGQRPQRTASMESRQLVQWFLYYPGVLDSTELKLSPDEADALEDTLNAYRVGDVLAALQYFPIRQNRSPDEQILAAALLLAVGQAADAENTLTSVQNSGDSRLGSLISGLQRLIGTVNGRLAQTNSPINPATATEWMGHSYQLQAIGDLSSALRAAQRAMELSPNFGFGWARVAELRFGLGDRGATEALEYARRLTPRNAQATALHGFFLAAENRTAEATRAFEEAIRTDPALGNAWLGHGLCRIKHGDVSGGREDLLIAAALEPQRSLLRSYLGKAFSSERDNTRALAELDLAINLDRNDPTAWLYSALVLQQENRINEALRALEASQRLNNNRAVYRSQLLLDQDRSLRGANLAALYGDAGLPEVSLREAARAVSTDYANYSAHLMLAESYNLLRDPRQVTIRYETPWLSEYLVANILAPVGAGILSPQVTQQEYSRLFERNRIGVSSATEYLSNGDWLQAATLHGLYGNSSFSIEEVYRSENGYRPNSELEQFTGTMRLKQQITPEDSVFFQSIYYRAKSGDLRQHEEPSNAQRTLGAKETQDPIVLAGYHHEWSPQSHTLLLGSYIQDDVSVLGERTRLSTIRRMNGVFRSSSNAVITFPRARDEVDGWTAEAQQIWQGADHAIIAGAKFQQITVESGVLRAPAEVSFPSPTPFPTSYSLDAQRDFDRSEVVRASGYVYDYWQIIPKLTLVGGLSYDWLRYPENAQVFGLGDPQQENSQLLPKAGVLWTPWLGTTFRGAYSRSIGGVSLEQSFRLEPSQVAGFNQAFRSVAPENVLGLPPGAPIESKGVAFDQKFPSGTYVGVEFESLNSDGRFASGLVEVLDASPPQVMHHQISSTRPRFRYSENTFSLTGDQLLGNNWVVGARYRFSAAVVAFREDKPLLFLRGRSDLDADLHQVHLHITYNHRCGFFGRMESVWLAQDGRQGSGDEFWQYNFSAGWRFLERRLEFQLGVLNIADTDYRLNPLNIMTELPRERTFFAATRFDF